MTQEDGPDAEGEAEQLVQQIRELLTSLPADLWRTEVEVYAEQKKEGYRRYAPGSQAHRDASADSEQAIDLLLTKVHNALMGAMDHMAALDRALAEAPARLLVSPWSIARSALEAEARAHWLLAPERSLDKVARAILVSLRDTDWGLVTERRKVASDPEVARRFAERMESYRALSQEIARHSKLKIEWQRRKEVRTVSKVGGHNIPTLTLSVGQMLSDHGIDENYYGLLSEIGHHNSLAKGLAVIEVMPAIIFHVVSCFSAITWRYFGYCGLDREQMASVLDKTWTEADFPASPRFWKQPPQPQR